jgi:hypothetical protein
MEMWCGVVKTIVKRTTWHTPPCPHRGRGCDHAPDNDPAGSAIAALGIVKRFAFTFLPSRMLLAQKSIKIDHLRCVFRLAQFIVLPGQTRFSSSKISRSRSEGNREFNFCGAFYVPVKDEKLVYLPKLLKGKKKLRKRNVEIRHWYFNYFKVFLRRLLFIFFIFIVHHLRCEIDGSCST